MTFKTLCTSVCILVMSAIMHGQTPDSTRIAQPEHPFKVGEELKFVLSYGFFNAGEAIISLESTSKKFQGNSALHVVGKGRTLGAFDWFFKVRDRYESYIDKDSLRPYHFIRRVNEGGHKINQDYHFDYQTGLVRGHKKKVDTIPPNIQDMISAFYYARSFQFDTAKVGDIYTVTSYVDGEIFPLNIKYVGQEAITIRLGKYNCHKFVPVVQEGRIFKSEDDLHVWISADGNRVPLLVAAEVLVGSIKMELTGYKNLKYPLGEYPPEPISPSASTSGAK